jgi:hypothetical protein
MQERLDNLMVNKNWKKLRDIQEKMHQAEENGQDPGEVLFQILMTL